MEEVNTVKLALNIAVAIIMLGMGLGLTLGDFKRIKEQPLGVLAGLLNQMLLLPLIAFGIIKMFGLTGQSAVGLMLISACPGGATSNLLTNLARGNMGLSITLTAISSSITAFTIPLILTFSINYFLGAAANVEVSFTGMLLEILLVTVVPIAVGMAIRKAKTSFAAKMTKPVKVASVILLAGIIIGAVITHRDRLGEALPIVGPAIIALNITTMLVGFFSGILFKLDLRQRVSVSIESGIQNASLALMVGGAAALQVYPDVLLAPALYGVLMFFTGGLLSWIYGELVKRSEPNSKA